jgi:DNA polymerase IV
MKILCVLLPHFSWRCEVGRDSCLAGRPAIVTGMAGSQKLVLDYSPDLAGLQPEMPLQQALAKHGKVTLIQADVPYYRSVFNGILDSLETKSPLVEDFDIGQAYLGMDGMESIYADDAALAASVKEIIPEVFVVQMGIAGGKFPAYLAALGSPAGGYRTLGSDVRSFLQDLDCDVLPVSLKSKDKLRSFGIVNLGQAASLPVGPLQAQFGPEGRSIWELAQGYDASPLYPRFMEENIEESLVLSSVTVSLEAILITAELLLAKVFSRDCLRGRGIRSLNLWTRGWDAGHWEHKIQFKEAALDIRSILSRLRQFLESYPQPGPVEQVGLKVTGLGYRSGKQRSLFPAVRARDRLLDDIKQLDQRLGKPQVFKMKEVEPWSRIPERRYALVPLSQ